MFYIVPREIWFPRFEDTVPGMSTCNVGTRRVRPTRTEFEARMAEEAKKRVEHMSKQGAGRGQSVIGKKENLRTTDGIEIMSL